MNRLLPIILASSLFLGETALAQEDPIFDDLNADIAAAIAEAHEAINAWEGQTPSGSASTNPDFLNPDILNAVADLQEALTDAITGALVIEAAGIIETLPDILNPDILDPDVRGEDPEVALSELIAALGEAVRGALQQQGRVILDSDFNEIP